MSARVLQRFTWVALFILGMTGCATPVVAPTEVVSQDWSFSQSIQSDHSMITLFDPADLVHHEGEPADWYRYDFAFANDLETGRFTAVLTGRSGNFDVRLTSGILSDNEQKAAGPRATMRLRVINGQLLLSGGDAWPSVINNGRTSSFDPHWIGIENGDYEVIITALDRQQGTRHDFVFQFLAVDDIALIPYAPGIPHLVVGEPAAVAGINAGGLKYHESCATVPRTAVWSPLTSSNLPVPGSNATIDLAKEFHEQGIALQAANKNAAIPIVIARKPVSNSIGLFIRPDTWQSNQIVSNGEVSITTRVLCAVRIIDVVPGNEAFALQIEALPRARDKLDAALSRELTSRFESWVRLTSDPAWRFKSAQIKRTHGDRAILLGIMDYLELTAKFSESILGETNTVAARRLLEHMSAVTVSAGR